MERGFTEILVFVQVLTLFFPSVVLPLQRFSRLPPRSCEYSYTYSTHSVGSVLAFSFQILTRAYSLTMTPPSPDHSNVRLANHSLVRNCSIFHSHLSFGPLLTSGNRRAIYNNSERLYLDFMISFTVSILARSYFGSCYILVRDHTRLEPLYCLEWLLRLACLSGT